jgi:glycosyltransferase involved in cell wall biosynthesis
METVSIILNSYRRTRWFPEQLEAIKKQTHPVQEIFVWQNKSDAEPISDNFKNEVIFIDCNQNLGVWARFSLALNCRSDYICIFDDDTIPGSKWIQNCIDTYKTNPGLLGTVGVIFGDKYYSWKKVERLGWCKPNEKTEKVDIVGHCWFFHRDVLPIFWREMPPKGYIPIVGEDIHFAKMIQKYTDGGVYVPPHPKNDIEMWGSIKGENYGHSNEAISMNLYNINGTQMSAGQMMGMELCRAVDEGFKLIKES